MASRMRVAFVLLFAVSGVACISARALPLGEPAPPRDPSCPLSFDHVAPSDAAARWRQVGVVCVAHVSGYQAVEEIYEPGEARDLLVEHACALGGEHVSPVGLCVNARANGIEFGVYRAR
jgi:hypothetical protein